VQSPNQLQNSAAMTYRPDYIMTRTTAGLRKSAVSSVGRTDKTRTIVSGRGIGSAAAQVAGLEDGKVLADNRHIALIAVPKRSTILACPDTVGDDTSDKSSLLNCCLRHSGHGVTILNYCGSISHHKHVGCLGYVHEGAYEGASRAVCPRSKHFYNRSGADARCPKHGGAGNPGATCDHARVINSLDLYARGWDNTSAAVLGIELGCQTTSRAHRPHPRYALERQTWRPIVEIDCINSSSESWGPQTAPYSWHSRAGGGAVNSITSGGRGPRETSTIYR
jgi:hypothetical protein